MLLTHPVLFINSLSREIPQVHSHLSLRKQTLQEGNTLNCISDSPCDLNNFDFVQSYFLSGWARRA